MEHETGRPWNVKQAGYLTWLGQVIDGDNSSRQRPAPRCTGSRSCRGTKRVCRGERADDHVGRMTHDACRSSFMTQADDCHSRRHKWISNLYWQQRTRASVGAPVPPTPSPTALSLVQAQPLHQSQPLDNLYLHLGSVRVPVPVPGPLPGPGDNQASQLPG